MKLKSLKFILLTSSSLLFSFCSKDESIISEPETVYIKTVISTPTEKESITIKNNTGYSVDISHWTIGDLNDKYAYTIPDETILEHDETIFFIHTTLGFQINDKNEILYLKDKSGDDIYTWSN